MKRFLLVLVILAGGVLAAALSIPSTAATVDGATISQNQLNGDLTAIANSPDYQCYLNSQEYVGSNGSEELPPILGAGETAGESANPKVTTAFAGQYLSTLIGRQLIFNLAADRNLHPTTAQLAQSRKDLSAQITQVLSDSAQVQSQLAGCTAGAALTSTAVLASMPTAFVDEQVQYQATVEALESSLTPPSSDADLQRYFEAHRATFDTACVSIAAYASQSALATGQEQVASGTPFDQVASAAESGSGPQGCQILYGLAQEFSTVADLYTLQDNTLSPPISLGNGTYILLEITSRTPSTFAGAKSAVRAAVDSVGSSAVGDKLHTAEKAAHVTVDPRYGTWKGPVTQLVLPPTPAPSDVTNATANLPVGTKATPASTGKSG